MDDGEPESEAPAEALSAALGVGGPEGVGEPVAEGRPGEGEGEPVGVVGPLPLAAGAAGVEYGERDAAAVADALSESPGGVGVAGALGDCGGDGVPVAGRRMRPGPAALRGWRMPQAVHAIQRLPIQVVYPYKYVLYLL
jgi:hypothetical protein